MNKRLSALFVLWLPLVSAGCSGDDAALRKRVIVLGFDGLDHALTKRLLDQGKLPNLARLAGRGGFQPLQTSVPPQSPVAWSEFITGLDAGGHGIFDFVHRDPETMLPYLSTTRTEPPGRVVRLGKWQIPLSGGKISLLRHGTPFWELLEERGIPAWIIRMPANFPPSGLATRELSGMGTPDILGTYGTFSVFTTSPDFVDDDFKTQVFTARMDNGVFQSQLKGPSDPFLAKETTLFAPFTVYVDADQPVAKIVIANEEALIVEGEWSEWLPADFDLSLPAQRLHAMVRFYLRRVRPELQLYATPVNLDPHEPAMPISSPAGFADQLARANGRFYTQGMPEDTKALTAGVFDRDDFLRQASMTAAENRRQLHWLLNEFKGGLLFYYFGHIDQVSHMLWGATDPAHPAHDSAADTRYAHVVENLYVQADSIVGETLAQLSDEDVLIVMSDHGFTSWKRAINLNTFLEERGYLAVDQTPAQNGIAYFPGVDWSRTQAYALGLNGVYINLRGRERLGIVPADQRRTIMAELSGALLRLTDPATGERMIERVYNRDETYTDKGHADIGPDMIVGYAKGYRGSNESAVGQITRPMVTDNLDEWSGDHAMVHDAVPGVLFHSTQLHRPVALLRDLAAAVLAEFGIDGFPGNGDQKRAR